MKENKEWECSDIAIDCDMEVDCDIGQEITCYIETWFDVDEKFGLHIGDDGSSYFDYEPTKAESFFRKDLTVMRAKDRIALPTYLPTYLQRSAVFFYCQELYRRNLRRIAPTFSWT